MNLGPLLWIPLALVGLGLGLYVIWLLAGFLGVGIVSAARSRRRSDKQSAPL